MFDNNMAIQIKSTTMVGNESRTLGGGYFRISSVKWPEWYIYVTWSNNVKSKKDYPGDEGQFKFIKTQGDYYLISSKHKPNHYLFTTRITGDIKVKEGDPGPSGHWRIQPRSDGTIILSTEKWNDYYMYVQESPNGDVQGTNKKPESLDGRAYFILSCDIQLKLGYDCR